VAAGIKAADVRAAHICDSSVFMPPRKGAGHDFAKAKSLLAHVAGG
jgi:hypothetical protein